MIRYVGGDVTCSGHFEGRLGGTGEGLLERIGLQCDQVDSGAPVGVGEGTERLLGIVAVGHEFLLSTNPAPVCQACITTALPRFLREILVPCIVDGVCGEHRRFSCVKFLLLLLNRGEPWAHRVRMSCLPRSLRA